MLINRKIHTECYTRQVTKLCLLQKSGKGLDISRKETNMVNVAAVRTKTKTVLITGASGFLGQHLVKLAHIRNDQNITKLVLFDKVPFTKKLDYKESIPQKTVVGDVTDIDDIGRAMTSVDYVIHCCSHVDVKMFPDPDLLEKTNVHGTKNVISCCVKEGVKGLVYTGSVIAVADDAGIDMADESYPYPDENALSSAYAATKQRAEKLVLAANATPHASGSGSLLTAVLRPPGIYGEGDWVFITQLLTSSIGGWCFMPLFTGDDPPTQQIVYVGNAAWAHLCAIKTLEENPRDVSGEVFNLTDDTPAGSYDTLCRPLVSGVGYAYVQIPHQFVFYCLYLTQLLLSIVRVFVGVNIMFSPRIFKFIGAKVTFNGRKLRTTCKFKPMFSYHESLQNSIHFYRTVVKDPANFMFGDWSISKVMSWIQEGVSTLFTNISKKLH